jgi:hypothetical protein
MRVFLVCLVMLFALCRAVPADPVVLGPTQGQEPVVHEIGPMLLDLALWLIFGPPPATYQIPEAFAAINAGGVSGKDGPSRSAVSLSQSPGTSKPESSATDP